MKKMTIAIAICTTLFLAACGRSGDTESSNPTSSNDPMTEQDTATLSEQQTSPADQSVETTPGTSTQSEQAAFEVGKPDDSAQGTQQD